MRGAIKAGSGNSPAWRVKPAARSSGPCLCRICTAAWAGNQSHEEGGFVAHRTLNARNGLGFGLFGQMQVLCDGNPVEVATAGLRAHGRCSCPGITTQKQYDATWGSQEPQQEETDLKQGQQASAGCRNPWLSV